MSDGKQEDSRKPPLARLVVVGIGLLLVACLGVVWVREPVILCAPDPSYIGATRGTMISLRVALEGYHQEYARWPIENSPTDQQARITSRGPLLAALLGQDRSLNPGGIEFAGFKFSHNGRSGIWNSGQGLVLNDWWGNEFLIELDLDHDGQIANPEPKHAQEHSLLPVGVLIFSAGPDGDPATWEDNIRNWK